MSRLARQAAMLSRKAGADPEAIAGGPRGCRPRVASGNSFALSLSLPLLLAFIYYHHQRGLFHYR